MMPDTLKSKIMKLKLITLFTMALFSFFGCGSRTPDYPTDVVTYGNDEQIKFTFFKHASFCITYGDRFEQHHIYIDPVAEYAQYAHLPKADAVLITHSHYDHFDRAAVEDVTTKKSVIICDKTTAESLDGDAIVMTSGMQAQLDGGIIIEAVAAYNTSEGHTDFHPKAREDNGYIIRFEGLNIYVAGDTEPTEEMKSLKDIDIAFLPVNQPYTMTVDQAVEAIKAIKPRIFYPYHYGEVDEKTDIERLKRELKGITDVRVFPME